MVNVTAATSFYGTAAEKMWTAGETRRVSAARAHELIEEGLAIEASDQSEPKPAAAPAQSKEDKPAATRATKPATGPTETK